MEFEEYQIMYEAEDTHWWYQGLRGVTFTLLGFDRGKGQHLRILDAGAGTGGNIQALKKMGYKNVEGFDFSPMALHFCRRRGLESVQLGSITDIPHAEGSYDVVISCDVLNDANIEDDNLALRELYRVLKPGGRLFLNLPAFGFLRGEHDQATSVVRRYTRSGISRQLRDAGFKVRRVTYWNMLLFPAVLAVRHLRSGRSADPEKPARSDIVLPPAPINTLLTLIVRLERLLLRKINLPLGSSVAVVAVKPRQARERPAPG